MTKFHQAFGVYGMYARNGALLVMKKTGGPYINRYDLPGGSLEDGEGLTPALWREFREETGRTVKQAQQVMTVSFTYPWEYLTWQYNQHIAVFYQVTALEKGVATVTQFAGQDSLGGVFVPFAELTLKNASPLVLKAKDYYLAPEKFFATTEVSYPTWSVLAQPVY